MLRLIAHLLAWRTHPRAVVHELESCPACRAILMLQKQQKLAYQLACELWKYHCREQSLIARCLCIRDPEDEESASRRAAWYKSSQQ